MESHSRGLRLRTARPIRFPGTPSPKGTSFRDESVENSTAGYSKTSMREFYTVSAARFRNADRPACAPDPPCVAGHIRSFLWRQGIRDAFVIAGPVPFSPAQTIPGKRASQWLPDRRERNAGTRRPHSTVSRYVASGKLPDPQAPRTQETKDLRTRNFRREPESVPDPRPTERPAERPGAVGLESKSGKRSFRTVRHQRGVIAFGK